MCVCVSYSSCYTDVCTSHNRWMSIFVVRIPTWVVQLPGATVVGHFCGIRLQAAFLFLLLGVMLSSLYKGETSNHQTKQASPTLHICRFDCTKLHHILLYTIKLHVRFGEDKTSLSRIQNYSKEVTTATLLGVL